jgi:hypothetical protein
MMHIDELSIPTMNVKKYWQTKQICHLAEKLGLIVIKDVRGNSNDNIFILSKYTLTNASISRPLVEGTLDDIKKYLDRLWELKAFL